MLSLSGRIASWGMGRWVRAIWNEWQGASDSGVEWWKGVNDETMNLLVHSSLSNVSLSNEGSGTIVGRWIRTVWNEWQGASDSGVEWWKGVNNETVNL